MRFFYPLLSLFSFSYLFPSQAHAEIEYFSSFAHLQMLKQLEYQVIEKLNSTLTQQQEQLNQLKTFIKTIKNEDLKNPVNQYKMIRRMTTQWSSVLTFMDKSHEKISEDFDETIQKFGSKPKESDLYGAREALVRLQETYKLDTKNFANGQVFQEFSDQKMSSFDCFEMAKVAFEGGNNYYAMQWLRESHRRFLEGDVDGVDEFSLLDYLSYSLGILNYRKFAIQVSDKMIYLYNEKPASREFSEDEFYRLSKNREYWAEELAIGHDFSEHYDFSLDLKINKPLEQADHKYEWWPEYNELCRQQTVHHPDTVQNVKTPSTNTDKLFCFYDNQNFNPRLILKPSKVELITINPTKVIFRDFVSEEEAMIIKALATDGLYRTTVHNFHTGELEHAKYRIQKNNWLSEDTHDYVTRINLRIADATGLSMESAEDLQVANYGLGGQYEPHFDHSLRKNDDHLESIGNRIATVLVYLTNVEEGGHTVFLDQKLSLKPRLGDAAFWYNLKPSGEGDSGTKHAGCPVLIGQKWVANKWIHERGNEFRRVCGLDENDESRFEVNGWRKQGWSNVSERFGV